VFVVRYDIPKYLYAFFGFISISCHLIALSWIYLKLR